VRRELAEPTVTRDGTAIAVLANVGAIDDAALAASYAADGIGLSRLEQFYLSRTVPPSEEELIEEIGGVCRHFPDKPVTVRLLDAGGDKDIGFLNCPEEADPFLGRRGVRLLLANPELVTAQLRALLRLSSDHNVRIMVPMVTLAEEMEEVRTLLESAAAELDVRTLPPLGAMVETPAAALCAADIAAQADFLSLGTNDLTQYTMAAGRENPLVEDYFQEDHPAVLRLIRTVLAEAHSCPVALCGEIAGRTDDLQTLVRLGLRTFSVAPGLVPEVKYAVRRCSTTSPGKT
jgi:phosphoenolpyruvate-protein kinase (PTS system EI component)